MPLAEMSRYFDLSRPRDPRAKFDENQKTITGISEKVKNYRASQRIIELAVPRRHGSVGGHFIPYSNYLHLISRL